ncbi:single-stranded DNA-binding protein [Microbacterium sp. SA39]|uniref:single-stranded DNA-binding protein n=1 Tax=Microbacterium sp. SA39 TaxID=1263625 RepID=UPI0005FA7016|nr:single-stranded DNA-binding protein [Microbacterium sp. SA39]KJQ52913.1 Single-stranded DNA-binding protein 1 [Microbacterium sp. SA39]
MNDTVTIVGRVATDPTQGQTGGGDPVTNFRLASTHRRFDNSTQTWTDSDTNWFSVAAFRQLGEHAKASLRTGDSVIVTGRLKIRTWESNGKQGTSVDIIADAIGHDLRWGTSAFLARSRATPSDSGARGSSPDHRTSEPEVGRDAEDGIDGEEDAGDELSDLDISWAEVPAGGGAAASATAY